MEERVGAAVVVWRRGAGGAEFLLLHRSGREAAGPWSWTFPSGGCEPGEVLADCARRELFEETGLRLTIEPVVVPGGYPVFRAMASDTANIVMADGEHDDYRWVTLDDAAALVQPERVADDLRAVAESLTY
jgi:8-oxo-dGTP pyrophosphatase MutT (NUDIX family)